MKNKQGNIAVIALIIVIVAITAGAVGYLFANKTQTPVAQPVAVRQSESVAKTQQPAAPIIQPSTLVDETANLQTYTNSENGFSFKNPVSWTVKSAKPGDIGGEFLEVSPKDINTVEKKGGYLVGVEILKSRSDSD